MRQESRVQLLGSNIVRCMANKPCKGQSLNDVSSNSFVHLPTSSYTYPIHSYTIHLPSSSYNLQQRSWNVLDWIESWVVSTAAQLHQKLSLDLSMMHFGKSSNHLCLAIHKFNQVRREHCPGNWTGNVPSGLLIDIKMLYLAQPGSQNSQNRKCRQFSGQILKTLIQWITWSVHLSRLSLWKSLTCYSNHLTVSAPQSITKPQKMSRKKSEKTRECPWGKHPTCCGSGRCGRCSRCGRCGQSCNEIGFHFHQICNGWTWLNLVEPPSIMHRQSHFGRVFPEPGVPALLHSRALGSNQNRPGRTRRHLEQPRTGCQLRRFGSVMPCPNFIPCSKSSKKCSNKLPVWTPGRNADFFGTHGTQSKLQIESK